MPSQLDLQNHIRPKAFSRWLSGSSHRFILKPRREGSKIIVVDRGGAAAVIWIPMFLMAMGLSVVFVLESKPWKYSMGMGWLFLMVPLAVSCCFGYRGIRTLARRSVLLVDQQHGSVLIEQSWPRKVKEECRIDECTVVLCDVYMSRRWGLSEDGKLLVLLTPREYFTLGIHADRDKLLQSDVVRAIGKPVIESSECIWARTPF